VEIKEKKNDKICHAVRGDKSTAAQREQIGVILTDDIKITANVKIDGYFFRFI